MPAYRHLPRTAGRRLVPYSDDADHRFQQADRRFRAMPITLEERRSIETLGGGVEG